MKKNKVTIFIILLIILIFLFSFMMFFLEEVLSENKINAVCISKNCFEVEIADNQIKRQIGLSSYDSLDKDSGMLFIFESEDEYSFWMKNMSFPLDIIWINEEREIVYIAQSVSPCNDLDCPLIKPNKKAIYILEINSGLADELIFSLGDRVEFKKVNNNK